jgi:hypothetical protein
VGKLRDKIRLKRRLNRVAGLQKVFCVGANKTGTTSIGKALVDLGFVLGNQRAAEKLVLADWGRRDFSKIIEYCRTAQAFQDAPFSYPYTYQAVDMAFPRSKFVLTVRDSSDQWYNSFIRFQAKMWSDGHALPTKKDLQNAFYLYKGRPWETKKLVYNTPEEQPYHKQTMISHYERQNASVVEYFRMRPNDLLVLNLSDKGGYQRLCGFLGVQSDQTEFPWENKTNASADG